MQLLRDAWKSADTPTRITMIAGVVVLVVVLAWQGVDLAWLPGLLQ